MNRIFIHLVDLPMAVKGVTIPDDPEGDYIVFINSNLCYESRGQVLQHELRHIRMNHFGSDLTVIDAEFEAGAV